MRKAERLDYFYDEMSRLHKKYLCDWRFNQMIINYLSWHLQNFGNDGFYVEEDDMIDRFRQFLSDMTGVEDVY